MSYYTESLKPRSEKITLVTCEAVERLKIFTLNGPDYERVVDNFVVGVKDSGTSLTLGTLPLSANEYYFEPTTKTLSVNVGANPKTRDISVTYRLFFSNAPVNAPYDLSSGADVEWGSYVNSIGTIGQQLDDENTGIVLESSSSVDFINSDGRFDSIFDKYIWENQAIKFYSWFPESPIAYKALLFTGIIESKSFSESKVSFKVVDFIYKLKNKVDLGLFSESDGTMLPSLIGTAKRRIYGQADYVKCASLDATLNGYAITGTSSATISTNILTGTGTSYLSELSPKDELLFEINGETRKIAIESIESNTSLTLGKIIDFPIVNSNANVKPKINSRYKNRKWAVAHHKLRSPSIAITSVIANNRFEVSNTLDFFGGDEITVNGIQAKIRRISGNEIVTESAISPLPIITNLIVKRPISAVYFGSKLLTYNRDYLITNSTKSEIIIDELAEFNTVEGVGLGNSLVFTNGSRSITTTDTVDLRSILKPRDWIRSSNISEPDWYEILDVLEQEIVIRTNFTGASATKTSYYKNIDYMNEESLITVNCMGMERNGLWIKTASDAVRDLVLNDAEFATVNEGTFTKANADCGYILSIVIPEDLGGEYPLIRDIITKVNESVFGVLFGDLSQNISYSIFNATKPETMLTLKDDDIISFTVQSTQKIVNEAVISYRPYVDVHSEENSFKVTTHQSSFVDKYIGIKSSTEKTVYLYEDDKAEIIAQRICFFRSLSNSIVTIRTKLNTANLVVNDKIYLSLDRLFKRYSGTESNRVGVVSGIKKDGFGCEISLSDLGNIYNRTMSVSPNSTLDYLSSSGEDRLKWGYITDNNTETPDPLSESGLGSNLIG
jgi:hypothetical protein